MFLAGWRLFGEPKMSRADHDVYWADIAPIARMLGADPVPVTDQEAQAQLDSFMPELRSDQRSRTVRDIITRAPPARLSALPVQALLMRSAIDLLPPWARRMHRLRTSG